MFVETLKEELVKYIDYIVPVLGDEVLCVNNIPLQEYIVQQFEKDYPDLADSVSKEERSLICNGGCDGLALLSHRYNFKGNFDAQYLGYISKIRKQIKLNEEVKKYLEITKPELIITTSSFSFIEAELNLDTESFWYMIDGEDKTKYKEKLSPKGKTIVYHLFGNAEKPRPDWVFSEKQLLKFIHCLHDRDSSPSGLTRFLKEQSKLLLILGSKLPNWFFQFVLYPLNDDFILSKKAPRQGFWLKETSNDVGLESFLEDIYFLSMPQLESVLKTVNEYLETNYKSSAGTDENYDIFISHSGEDLDLALKIAEHLESKHLKVWIDRTRDGKGEVEKGGDYWKRIEKGIKKSRYFMPIVTSSYLAKWLIRKYKEKEFGLTKETEMAIEWHHNTDNANVNAEVYSLPVVGQKENLNNGLEAGAYPDELFKDIQCYFYTNDKNDTFINHPWENYKNKH